MERDGPENALPPPNGVKESRVRGKFQTSKEWRTDHYFPIGGGMLQRKLTIGANNDPMEKEADQVAKQVMAKPEQFEVSRALPNITRVMGQPMGQSVSTPASVNQILANPGRPLEPVLRLDMERRFDHDFSQVRVHMDATAAQSARDMSANAYTVGNDIVFGSGRYAPMAREGQQLIAHELNHVIQKRLYVGTNTGLANSNVIDEEIEQKSKMRRHRQSTHVAQLGRCQREKKFEKQRYPTAVNYTATIIQRQPVEDAGPKNDIDMSRLERGEEGLNWSGGRNSYYYLVNGNLYFSFDDPDANSLLSYLIREWIGTDDGSVLRETTPRKSPPWVAAFRTKAKAVPESASVKDRRVAELALRMSNLAITKGDEFRENLIEEAKVNLGQVVESQKSLDIRNDPKYTTCIPFVTRTHGKTPVPEGTKKPVFRGIGYQQISLSRKDARLPTNAWHGIWEGGSYKYSPPKQLKERPNPGDFIIIKYHEREPLGDGEMAEPGWFKHIAILLKIARLENGEEQWISLDGGQEPLVKTPGGKKRRLAAPAKEVTRIFNPQTGLVCGATSGSKCRRLQGWIDVAELFQSGQ